MKIHNRPFGDEVQQRKQLYELAERILDTHVEGTAFFDAMDASLKQEPYFLLLLRAVAYRYVNIENRPHLVVSGHFGAALDKWLKENPFWLEQFGTPLKLPGSLRHKTSLPLDDLKTQIAGKTFIFLDDTIYKSRTRNLISKEIGAVGGKVVYSFILYDGAATPFAGVTCFYRYFEHHPYGKGS